METKESEKYVLLFFIKQLRPTLNIHGKSVLLKLFN